MMQDTILVRVETSPEDIQGMHAAKGILTARGGMTSHAAVVAEVWVDHVFLAQVKLISIMIKEFSKHHQSKSKR